MCKLKRITLLFLCMLLAACTSPLIGESGAIPMPLNPPVSIPDVQVPPAPLVDPIIPPVYVPDTLPLQQEAVPDTLPWTEVVRLFEDAKPVPEEQEGVDEKVDTETDPNRLGQKCNDKPGIPDGTTHHTNVVKDSGSEAVLRYLVGPDGKPMATGVLSRLEMPNGTYITHSIRVFPPYGQMGVATELANLLIQDWIKEFGTSVADKVVWINFNPTYKYTCYWRDKVRTEDVQDWDGETWYPTHKLIP